MEKITTELAVIAAGPAGLAAAIAAAEQGVKVCVFEKGASVGGTANMGMGPFGVESNLQKRTFGSLTKEDAFLRFMDYEHWTVDANLVHNYIWKSGDTINWLEDMGVKFAAAAKYFPDSEATWHLVQPEGGPPGPRAAGTMTRIMADRARELGVELYMETPALRLLKEDEKVVGLVAERDGEEIEVSAKAVVVATGGFGSNVEMIREECGYTFGVDIFSNRVPGLNGDGMKMAWAVGAKKSQTEMELILDSGIPIMTYPGAFLFRQPSILVVNKLGERIMNEELIQNASVSANIVNRQKDRTAYAILTDKIVKRYGRQGLDYPTMVVAGDPTHNFDEGFEHARALHPDCAFCADSIEELAEQIGIDPDALMETVDRYNEHCDLNYDDDMCKSRKYLRPIEGKKFYAERVALGAYGSLGGIAVNAKLEVVDEDDRPIAGLYGAGSDVCNIYNGTYMFYFPGSTMGFALNSGRMAGEHAAEYILG